jgi:hypothetical protein
VCAKSLATKQKLVTVPPILFSAAISLRARRRGPLLVRRVLPAIAVAAAMRASAVVLTPAARRQLPHDEPAPRTLLPIGQRSRLAAGIAAGAGALLPHPFTPYQGLGARDEELSLAPSP